MWPGDSDARFHSRLNIHAAAWKRYPHKDLVEPITHFDFIMTGYHREVVEVLHPWILEWDRGCIWASELLQTLEASLLYRNNMLSFKGLNLWNGKHRHRPAAACGDVLQEVMQYMQRVAPPLVRHCAIDQAALYQQGALTGSARKKNETLYHLMPLIASSHSYRHMINQSASLRGYFATDQTLFGCRNTTSWNRTDENCCSISTFMHWQANVSLRRSNISSIMVSKSKRKRKVGSEEEELK